MEIKEKNHHTVCNSRDQLLLRCTEKQPCKCQQQLRSPCACQELSVSKSHHGGRRTGYTCLWAPLKGSDFSFQMCLVAKICQQSFCVEILLGRGQEGTFQILW